MAFFFLLLFFAARPFSSLHGRNLSSNSRLSNKHMASCPWCYQAYLSMTLKEKKGATAALRIKGNKKYREFEGASNKAPFHSFRCNDVVISTWGQRQN